HFLYFVGLPFAGAVALLHDGKLRLFVEPRHPDDALWHGDSPSFDAIAAALGEELLPLEALEDALHGMTVGTIPAPDASTVRAQSGWLGRDVALPSEHDARVRAAIIELRLVHDEAALTGLRTAAAATVDAHRRGMAITRPGATEAEVCAAMEAELSRRGMCTAYGSIVSVHGEVLHNPHRVERLATGDLLLADVGAETVDGYAGDVTRTWPVSGRFSASQRAIYEIVLAAQESALHAARPGARFRDVHLEASRAIVSGLVDVGVLRGDVDELVADRIDALFFPHGIGHLLGLDVHDMEDLGDEAGYPAGRARSVEPGLRYLRLDRELAPGMVVTIEPGFYSLPTLLAPDSELRARAGDRLREDTLRLFSDVRGIRIEDDVLITGSGAVRLTESLPRAPEAVEALVGIGV
ncbi:MAG: aminopeptidase P family protein, partial [Polyangiaceae bacterium]|nr:aminopeptidase P family protein [Polyangiaceae bacterium]